MILKGMTKKLLRWMRMPTRANRYEYPRGLVWMLDSGVSSLNSRIQGQASTAATFTRASAGTYWAENYTAADVSGDELLSNTGFTSATTSWTADSSSIASVADGQAGNCLEITSTGATYGSAYQAITCVIGQLYTVSCYMKAGTASYQSIRIGTTTTGGETVNQGFFPEVAWALCTVTFVATATTHYVQLRNSNTNNGTGYYDTVSVKSFVASTYTMRTAVTNQPRFENGALLLEPAVTNKCTQSRNFGAWTVSGTPTEAQDQVGIDGAANTAWTIGDDSAAGTEGEVLSLSVAQDSNTHCFSVFIKKDTTTSRMVGLRIRYQGGTAIEAGIHVNTSTGAIADEAGGSTPVASGIDNYGAWWRAWLSFANNNSAGNTTGIIGIRPAIGTTIGTISNAAVGTCVVDGAQFEFVTKVPTSFVPTAGAEATRATEAGTTSWNIPQTSLGSELVTNGTMEADANWANYATPSTNERSTTQKYGGTYARKFVCDANDEGIQNTDYTSITSSLYRYDLWVYSSLTTVKVRIRKGDDSGDLQTTSHTVVANTWTELTGYFVETAGGAHAFMAVLAANTATVYVDDASVREVFTPFAEVLGTAVNPTNTGFENAGAGGDDVFSVVSEFKSDGAISQDAVTFHGGSKSAKLTCGATVSAIRCRLYFTAVTVVPGTTYKVSFWQYGDGTNPGGWSVYDQTNAVTITAITATAAAAASWVQYSYYVTAPSGCVLMRLYLYAPAVNTAIVYYDDATITPVTNAVAGGPPQGTVVVDFIPGINEADHSTAQGLVSCAADVLLLGIDTGGDLSNSDGTTVLAKDIDILKGSLFRGAVKWGSLTANVAKKNTGGGSVGAITWATEGNYDGAMTLGTALLLCHTAAYPEKIKKIFIFNRVLSDAEINSIR